MHTIKAEGRRTGPRVRYTVYKRCVYLVSLRPEHDDELRLRHVRVRCCLLAALTRCMACGGDAQFSGGVCTL